ncbi:MAG TPA: glycosyltransferase family 4 protein [Sedimentisphaerales bacterium]|nr:glycosyltransferase family 4 protein [Sedimentisphaerales bacterium]
MVQKVAIIIERTDVALGGAERSISEVADALSDLGLEIHLLAAKGETGRGNLHALCQDNPGKRVTLATFGDALRRHLAQAHYDIVHSVLPFDFVDLYQPRGGTYAEALLRNAASYANPPVRLFKKLTACVNRRRMELLRAERRLCQGSKGPMVAALSQYVVMQLRRHYGTQPERIVLTLNGVATDRKVDPIEAQTLRSQIVGAPQNKSVVFLFAAHNFRLKGLDRLLQALAMTESPARLAVVGEGRIDAPQRLARRLRVEDRIVFLGAMNQVQNAIAAADVGILPTFYDPSSRFILETLAAAKPVVTTRFNGAADHFVHGRHGIVVDSPDNIPALAEAIRYFTVPENLRQAAQAIAQDRLVEKISIRRVASELLGVYERIQERKKHL